jgi:hypothetical protein
MNYPDNRSYSQHQHQWQFGYPQPTDDQSSPPIGIYSSKMDAGHVYPHHQQSLPVHERNPMDIYFMTNPMPQYPSIPTMHHHHQQPFSMDPYHDCQQGLSAPTTMTDIEERVFGEFLRD